MYSEKQKQLLRLFKQKELRRITFCMDLSVRKNMDIPCPLGILAADDAERRCLFDGEQKH